VTITKRIGNNIKMRQEKQRENAEAQNLVEAAIDLLILEKYHNFRAVILVG